VNSLVPCDLCDHSQISQVVSNDVTSDILLTTLHVITDWPISDHMSIVCNGWLPVMPSIVYNYVVSCDWSRQSHDTDRANHSTSV
ncbi:unnamed protein product, partial [Staurois parvus]